MNYVNKSFIPSNNLTLALVDKRIAPNMEKSLNDLSIEVLKTPACSNTYDAIKHHPDICVCKLNNNNLVVAPNVYEYYFKTLSSLGFNIIKGNSIIDFKYPHNIQYNIAILKDFAIHNFKYTDKTIVNYLDKNNIKKINVSQGYAKCSICIVDENSIITSDKGVYEEVVKYNINCLLIDVGHIDLFELNYGFIGGCSGLISKDTLTFFGDITKHPNFDDILNFVKDRGKNILSLSSDKLLDLGSLIPLCEI